MLTIINIGILDKFDKELQKLKREITSDEATEAVVALNNNRAPGKDDITAEFIKYCAKNDTQGNKRYSKQYI